jgi:nucleoside 2-deoxyribosyltransferase
MKVYLAGPIANCNDTETNGWRDIATEYLTKLGFEVLNPMKRDCRDKEIDDDLAKMIVEADKKDIEECDFILANLWKIGVGSSMEILYAWENKKIIISVVSGNISPWIRYHSNVLCENLQSALEEIKNIKEMDDRFLQDNKDRFSDEPKTKPIKLQWCGMCKGIYVECPKCGNNSCNGGYGTLSNGEKCNCHDSYELMYAIGKNKEIEKLVWKLLDREEEWNKLYANKKEGENNEHIQ